MNKLEKAKEEMQKYVGEEVEVIAMTKEDFDRHIENVNQENMKLKDKVEQLQDKIDSAINYLEEHTNNGMFELRTDTGEVEELLNILKGSDNNE